MAISAVSNDPSSSGTLSQTTTSQTSPTQTGTATTTTDTQAQTTTIQPNLPAGDSSTWTQAQIQALTQTDIQALTQTQIADLTPTQIGWFQNSQIPYFTATQVAWFGQAQIGALSTGQIAALTSSQVWSLSQAQVGALSSAQLNAMSADQLNAVNYDVQAIQGISTATLQQLSASQVALLSPYEAASLSSAQIAALAPQQFAALSGSALAALSATQLAALPAASLDALSDAQLQSLAPSALQGVSAARLASLTNEQLSSLTSAQVAALPSAVFDDLTSAQWNALTATQIAAITTDQLANTTSLAGITAGVLNQLSVDQTKSIATVAYIPAATIAAIDPQIFMHFSQTQFSQFSASTVAQFTDAQIAVLAGPKIAKLGDTVAALSADQVASIQTSNPYGITPGIEGLTATQIGELSLSATSGLTATEISELSASVVSGFTSAQMAELTGAQLAGFTAANAAGLSPAQLGALSATQIAALPSAVLDAFTSTQWNALTSGQIAAITTNQLASTTSLAGITAGVLNQLSVAQTKSIATVAYIPAAAIAAIDPQIFMHFSQTQFSQFSASTVAQFTDAQIGVLAGPKIAALGDTVAALSADQVASIQTSNPYGVTPGIQGLTATQIGELSASGIAGLTGTQIAALSATQIGGITAAQIPLFSQAQIRDFLPAQIPAFTSAQLSALSGAQVGALTPGSFAALTVPELGALTPAQLGGITSQQIIALAPSQIAALPNLTALAGTTLAAITSVQIPAISAAQLQQFQGSAINDFSAGQFGYFTPTQIAALGADQFKALTTDRLAAIAPSSFAAISTAALQSLSTEQIEALTPAHIAALPVSDIASLTYDQVVALTPSQTAALSAGQLATILTSSNSTAFGPQNIAALTNGQIASLTPAILQQLTAGQIGSFTGSQIALFSAQQLAAFSPADVASLSHNALAALSATQISQLAPQQFSALTDDQLAALTPAQIAGVSAAMLDALSADQIRSLSPSALGAVAPALIATLSAGQLGAITAAQAPSLTAAQVGALSQQQILALAPDAVEKLGADALAAGGTAVDSVLTASDIAALDPATISKLQTSQIAALSSSQVGSLTGNQLASLSSAQIAALGTNVSALMTDGLASLSDAQVGALSASQVAALHPLQVGSLSGEQISQFGTAQLAAITSGQVAALSQTQVASLGSLAALSTSTLQAMDQSQVAALTTTQLSQLAGGSINNLAAVQFNALSSTQVASLSTAQLGALNAPNVANLRADALAALSTQQVQSFSSDQLNALATSQIQALTKPQVQALTAAQLSGLQPRVIRSLTTAQIQSLSASQIGVLSTQQIADLKTTLDTTSTGSATIADLTAQQVSELSAAQIQALTPAEIASLSASQLQAISTSQAAALTPIHIASLSRTQLSELSAPVVELLSEPLAQLGVAAGASYTSPDSAGESGAMVTDTLPGGFAVTGSGNNVYDVVATAAPVADGSFEAPLSGGTTPTATSPSSPLQAIAGNNSYEPTLAANQIFLQGTPFNNLIATADANGDGWYRAPSPTDVRYQISYNPSTGQWDYSDPYNSTGVWVAGLGGRDSYWDAYNTYLTHYGTAAPQPLPSNEVQINGTPFQSVVGVADGTGWYYGADPNDPNFQIGYNPSLNGWDFRNVKTGNGVVANGLVTETVSTNNYGGTAQQPIPAASYADAYQAYQTAFADAPAEYPPYNYQDAGLTAAPTDGTHTFNNTASPTALIGSTGVWSDVNEPAAFPSPFAPVDGSSAAVIGGNGSISQSLSNLAAGQWYAISFSAMTSAFEQVAQTAAGTTNVGTIAAAPQQIRVLMDGKSIGTFTTAQLDVTKPDSAGWQQFATAAFLGSSGTHTLTFQGLAPNGSTSSITLDNVQLLQVTNADNVTLPKGYIDTLTPAALAALKPDQLVSANDEDLQALDQAQIQALTTDQLPYFYGAAIRRFTPTQLSWLTPAQIAGLHADQIANLGMDVINGFSPAQLQAIPTLKALSTGDIQQMSTSLLSRFTPAQLATLTRSQLAVLTPSQIQALNPGVWSLFDATQIAGFSAFQLSVVPGSSLAAISTQALQGLAPVAQGMSLQQWLAMPSAALPSGALPSNEDSAALATALALYDANGQGSEADFSGSLFTDGSIAAGTSAAAPSMANLTFSGTAGIATDGSTLAGTNKSPDGTGYAGYVQGTGSFTTTVGALTPNQDYQISFNAVQGAGSTGEQVAVIVDGHQVGVFTPGATYASSETGGFTLTGSGPHTITFVGVDPNNQNGSVLISAPHIALAGEADVLSGGTALQDGDFFKASTDANAQQSAPATSAWTFAGQAGIQGPFAQAYVKNGGTVSQTVAGFENNRTYSIAFDAAQGTGATAGAIQVLVDGHVVDTVTPLDQTNRLQYTATFAPGSGAHTITFKGLGTEAAVFTNVRVLATGLTTDGAAIANGSFDSNGSGWRFGSQSGVVADSSAPSGTNAAYVQGNGSFSQSVDNFKPGETYVLRFKAKQNSVQNAQTLNVLVDGTVVGTFSPGTGYGTFSTSVFMPGAGTHHITFQGAGPGNNTFDVNDVELVMLPDTPVSTNAGSDGVQLVDHIPNQDEIQRLQWATLTQASFFDNLSGSAGGDDMLGVAPDMTGIAAAAAVANPKAFSMGWSNGATANTTVQVSADEGTVTRTTTMSDGSVYALTYVADNPADPAGSATVTEQDTLSSTTPVSSNGAVTFSAGGVADASPIAQNVLSAQKTLGNAAEDGGGSTLAKLLAELQAKLAPYQGTQLYKDATAGIDFVKFLANVQQATLAADLGNLAQTLTDLGKADPNGQAGLDQAAKDLQDLSTLITDLQQRGVQADLTSLSDLLKLASDLIKNDASGAKLLQQDATFITKLNNDLTLIIKGVRDFAAGGVQNDLSGIQQLVDVAKTLVTGESSKLATLNKISTDISDLQTLLADLQQSGTQADLTSISQLLKLAADVFNNHPKWLMQDSNFIDTLNTDLGQVLTAVQDFKNGGSQSILDGIQQLVTTATGVLNGQESKIAILDHISTDLTALKTLLSDLKQGGIQNDLTSLAQMFTLAADLFLKNSGVLNQDASFITQVDTALGQLLQAVQNFKNGGTQNDLTGLKQVLTLGASLLKNQSANLTADANYVTQLQTLLSELSPKKGSASNDFALAQSAAEIASEGFLAAGNKIDGNIASQVASALGGLSKLFEKTDGTGSLSRDLTIAQGTVKDIASFVGAIDKNSPMIKVLGNLANVFGDAAGVVDGFQTGGVVGGVEAGWNGDALIQAIDVLRGLALTPGAQWTAVIAGVVIGLAALFFGGNHDNPGNMPDKYDEPTYGQGVANLAGFAGATPLNKPYTQYFEDQHLKTILGDRTGIAAIQETLATYGSKENAPAWLRGQWDKLESMFGADSAGSGQLKIGINGGKDCNNQRVTGGNGQEYQYTQLDAALNEFQASYANAVAAGQATKFAYYNTSVPAEADYGLSYQSQDYLA